MAGRVKGIVVLSRREFVEREFGPDMWPRIIAALPTEHQAVLEGVILASSWVPLATCAELDEALVRVVGGRADDALRQLGRRSAEANLARVQQNYLTGKT